MHSSSLSHRAQVLVTTYALISPHYHRIQRFIVLTTVTQATAGIPSPIVERWLKNSRFDPFESLIFPTILISFEIGSRRVPNTASASFFQWVACGNKPLFHSQ